MATVNAECIGALPAPTDQGAVAEQCKDYCLLTTSDDMQTCLKALQMHIAEAPISGLLGMASHRFLQHLVAGNPN